MRAGLEISFDTTRNRTAYGSRPDKRQQRILRKREPSLVPRDEETRLVRVAAKNLAAWRGRGSSVSETKRNKVSSP